MATSTNRRQPARRRTSKPKAGEVAKLEQQATNTGRHAIHRYSSVYIAFAAGIVVAALALALRPEITLPLGAIAFFLTYLSLVVIRLPRLTPRHLRSHADESDLPSYLIMLVAVASLLAALVSLFFVLNGSGAPDRLRLALGLVALAFGWLAIHAMLAFHYAYEYYGTDKGSAKNAEGAQAHVGGLDFPGDEPPDALSFLYFSFVVAMTAQVSDVTVTSNAMRRLVLLHGIFSYFVNTVVIAVAVNVVVSLGH